MGVRKGRSQIPPSLVGAIEQSYPGLHYFYSRLHKSAKTGIFFWRDVAALTTPFGRVPNSRGSEFLTAKYDFLFHQFLANPLWIVCQYVW